MYYGCTKNDCFILYTLKEQQKFVIREELHANPVYFDYVNNEQICRQRVEWLKHRADDQHGLGSKSTCSILLCPWERHFTALSPA